MIALTATPILFAEAPIILVVADPPGAGFNDPTPVEPVGGNTGATLGEQRLIAFQYAAGIWSSKLDSSLPIRVRALFEPLPCTATTAALGGARPGRRFTFTMEDPEILPNVWYPFALANKLTERVLDGSPEIEASFNPNIGKPDCLAGKPWYYGLDNRAPAGHADMVITLLHELGHGLGFGASFRPELHRAGGRADVHEYFTLDTTTGRTWAEMTDDERARSATSTRRVVWNGINVRKHVPDVLRSGAPMLRITEPHAKAEFTVFTASFGAPLSSPGITSQIVVALDDANEFGPSTTDACSPLLNVSEVLGKIALADRGTCRFTQKALNAQAAGAVALVVVNNVPGSDPGTPTGTDPTITIPVVHIPLADGNALKAGLAASTRMNAQLLADPGLRQGADLEGRPYLYTPNPVVLGSTISHWDTTASPNLLMEPHLEDDLAHTLDDLTLSLLRDLGWFSDFDGVPDGVDQCPDSDPSPNLSIQGCDTGVRNSTLPTGCRISDFYRNCDRPAGGRLPACVEFVSMQMLQVGVIGAAESGRIQACAVRTAAP